MIHIVFSCAQHLCGQHISLLHSLISLLLSVLPSNLDKTETKYRLLHLFCWRTRDRGYDDGGGTTWRRKRARSDRRSDRRSDKRSDSKEERRKVYRCAGHCHGNFDVSSLFRRPLKSTSSQISSAGHPSCVPLFAILFLEERNVSFSFDHKHIRLIICMV